MGKKFVVLTSGIALNFCLLTSCDTPVGQGAAWGAATGAIIGGAATGHVRAASIGAAAGAAAGALTGAIIQENQAARYGRPHRVAFHTRAGPGRRVFITVLIQDASMTFEEFHPVDLRET
jgi:outer membrane lipoprotein SlyB